MRPQRLSNSNSYLDFINWWNSRYPYDRYYRKKYNIGFGSPEHRKLNFYDMAMDIKEDLIFNRKAKTIPDNEEHEEFVAQTGMEYEAGENQEEFSQEDIDAAYATLDISQFNDK